MGYKIGSFNMHNLGNSALAQSNQRDLRTIANIIRGEQFDVVALQEVLSQGKAFTSPEFAKRSILMELGPDWDFKWADAKAENDPRHEGFAFIWRKSRLRLCTTKVLTWYGEITRTFYPRICNDNHYEMKRRPYYGRFTASGIPGGTNVEFRLICVHTYYGKTDNSFERDIRQRELDVLMKDIYPQINDRRYGDPMTSYTVLLGDYNAELWTSTSRIWEEPLKKSRGGRKPAIMATDDNGIVESTRYGGRRIKTVQDQLTTLKSKEINGEEQYDSAGYSCNYDHFSYEEVSFEGTSIKVHRITDAVTKYCNNTDNRYSSNFEKYYKTISDHIPIMMEIELR